MNNNNVDTKYVTKSNVRTFDFEDQKGVVIPGKITCPCCGREVMGYPPLVQERVYKFYGGSWERYQKEWICNDCKKKTNGTVSSKLAEARRQQKLNDAIKLLEAEGYTITKEAEVTEQDR